MKWFAVWLTPEEKRWEHASCDPGNPLAIVPEAPREYGGP
jgi:hypothetical protein